MIDTRLSTAVDPARLQSGTWSQAFNKTVGEGDIAASYSADRIGMGKPVRKPFVHRGEAWVCVSRRGRGPSAEAYKLVPIDWYSDRLADAFVGQFFGSYAEKTADADWARSDPNGFYHGMIVEHGGGHFVMVGPPMRFTPQTQTQQPGLFDPG